MRYAREQWVSYRLGCARGLLGSNNGREGKEESLGEVHLDGLLFNKCRKVVEQTGGITQRMLEERELNWMRMKSKFRILWEQDGV